MAEVWSSYVLGMAEGWGIELDYIDCGVGVLFFMFFVFLGFGFILFL
jgi:hypothetical protein